MNYADVIQYAKFRTLYKHRIRISLKIDIFIEEVIEKDIMFKPVGNVHNALHIL